MLQWMSERRARRVIEYPVPNDQCQAVLRLNANTLKQNVFCYLEMFGDLPGE